MKRYAALALLGLVVFSTPQATSAAVGAEARTQRTVYVNIGHPEVKPERIFTAFSSSPYIDGVTWRRWGTDRAVGKGVYISDCASCSPPKRRTATVILTNLKPCPGKGFKAYRHAIVRVDRPDRGQTETTYELHAGCR